MKGQFFTPMPISDLINPNRGGYFYHMLNYWWPVTINDEVLFYGRKASPYSSPQCNLNKLIAETFRGHLSDFEMKPEPILIPVAFQPIRIADYQEN